MEVDYTQYDFMPHGSFLQTNVQCRLPTFFLMLLAWIAAASNDAAAASDERGLATASPAARMKIVTTILNAAQRAMVVQNSVKEPVLELRWEI